ncbi:MAG: 4Fe-4S dicluster domain-containing protein [Anaerovoracaceae bacterium]|jgi:Fe-S-cluster-containing dehydrogenase component
MKQHYIVIDVAKCSDCNNCFLACKDEHVGNKWLPYTDEQPRHGHRWMNIFQNLRGQFPRVDENYLAMPCQHCQDAPCIEAHPECISRRGDGIVLIDVEKAKGVKNIAESCPYGAIYWNEDLNIGQKCTMCAHILDNGHEPYMPRCVHSCSTQAMKYYHVEAEEMKEIAEKEGLENYKAEWGTNPHIYYKNLHLFTKAFIAGGLLKDNECAEGVEVTLKGDNVEASQITDYFGDFKFDGLSPGKYSLMVDGKEVKSVELEESLNVGSIVI